jgi:hypothetical protein
MISTTFAAVNLSLFPYPIYPSTSQLTTYQPAQQESKKEEPAVTWKQSWRSQGRRVVGMTVNLAAVKKEETAAASRLRDHLEPHRPDRNSLSHSPPSPRQPAVCPEGKVSKSLRSCLSLGWGAGGLGSTNGFPVTRPYLMSQPNDRATFTLSSG